MSNDTPCLPLPEVVATPLTDLDILKTRNLEL